MNRVASVPIVIRVGRHVTTLPDPNKVGGRGEYLAFLAWFKDKTFVNSTNRGWRWGLLPENSSLMKFKLLFYMANDERAR